MCIFHHHVKRERRGGNNWKENLAIIYSIWPTLTIVEARQTGLHVPTAWVGEVSLPFGPSGVWVTGVERPSRVPKPGKEPRLTAPLCRLPAPRLSPARLPVQRSSNVLKALLNAAPKSRNDVD
jgi:hypothetical protein